MRFRINLIILTFLILLTSCGRSNNTANFYNDNKMRVGYGLSLLDSKGNNFNSFVFNIDKQGIFDNIIKFTNNSPNDSEFVLLLFVDYNQVEFEIDKSKFKKYIFNAKSGSEVKIPVKFPTKNLNDGYHTLMISIVAGANKHASEINVVTNKYSVNSIYNFIINNGNPNKIQNNNNRESSYISIKAENDFAGILLNTDYDKIENFTIPPSTIYSKPNERFKLSLRAGGFDDTQEYVAIIVMDWEQVEIEKNKYLFFSIPYSSIIFQDIFINTPSQKGDYEICAFLIPNPWKKQDDGFMKSTHISTSYRFTLKVE